MFFLTARWCNKFGIPSLPCSIVVGFCLGVLVIFLKLENSFLVLLREEFCGSCLFWPPFGRFGRKGTVEALRGNASLLLLFRGFPMYIILLKWKWLLHSRIVFCFVLVLFGCRFGSFLMPSHFGLQPFFLSFLLGGSPFYVWLLASQYISFVLLSFLIHSYY